MIHLRPSDIRDLNNAIAAGKSSTIISLDLGLTKKDVALREGKLVLQKKLYDIPTLKKEEKTCFILLDDAQEFERIQFSGSETGQVYGLDETAGRPMLKVSATPHHKWDFIKRIENDCLFGEVFDAGTGLGYTAIAAAKTAARVITIEADPHVIEMQKMNPWSNGLTAENIDCVEGDVYEFLKTVPDNTFDAIILDGGTPRSSGDFFSLINYVEARRSLKNTGTLYHYLPNHGITRGRDFPAEVIKRLETAGFTKIKRYTEENYVVAQ